MVSRSIFLVPDNLCWLVWQFFMCSLNFMQYFLMKYLTINFQKPILRCQVHFWHQKVGATVTGFHHPWLSARGVNRLLILSIPSFMFVHSKTYIITNLASLQDTLLCILVSMESQREYKTTGTNTGERCMGFTPRPRAAGP